MEFRIWLAENTSYEPYRAQIDQAAQGRESPFESWFPPGGRIYLPLSSPEGSEGVDKDVADALANGGYRIQDYRQGTALDKYGRVTSIGKALASIERQEAKQLSQSSANWSPVKQQEQQSSHQKYWKELTQTFQNSAYRAHSSGIQSPYEVVISCNPHDVGQMSTGRDWTSCMDLNGGSNSDDVYKEVAKGGLVAYLIRQEDHDITKPLARIAIHRYDNKVGQSLAVPEDSVYGNPLPGFEEVVKHWLANKQSTHPIGAYKRRGGQYSDTYDTHYIHSDESGKSVLKMLRFGLSKGPWNPRRRPYVTAAMKSITAPGANYSNAVLHKVAAIISDPQNSVDIGDFSKKYPGFVTLDMYQRLPLYMQDNFDKIDPKFKDQRLAAQHAYLDQSLSVDNPDLGFDGRPLEYHALGKVQDALKQLNIFGNHLPQSMIQKVVDFGEGIMSKYDLGSDKIASNAVDCVIHHLHMGRADTPTVLRFYEKLLPYWEAVGGIDRSFGLALGSLGINGRPFLPFLKHKLQEFEASELAGPWLQQTKAKREEKYRYIIDSIENGTGRSDRYSFF